MKTIRRTLNTDRHGWAENSDRFENAEVTTIRGMMVASTMNSVLVALFALFASSFRARAARQAEILALRHQLAVLQRTHEAEKNTQSDKANVTALHSSRSLSLRSPGPRKNRS